MDAHLNLHLEERDNITQEKCVDSLGQDYMVLKLGFETTVFMSIEKFEQLKRVLNE